MGGKLKIFSLNFNGLHDNIKRKRLKMLLHTVRPEIFLLQETHLKRNNNMILKDRSFPNQWHSSGSSKARGTAILISHTVQFQEVAVLRDKEGRYVAVRGILNGETVTIVSIYTPNAAQITFLNQVFQKIREFGDGTMIVAGDYNYISDLKMDRSYPPSAALIMKNSSFTALHKLIDTHDLVDSWRWTNPQQRIIPFTPHGTGSIHALI